MADKKSLPSRIKTAFRSFKKNGNTILGVMIESVEQMGAERNWDSAATLLQESEGEANVHVIYKKLIRLGLGTVSKGDGTNAVVPAVTLTTGTNAKHASGYRFGYRKPGPIAMSADWGIVRQAYDNGASFTNKALLELINEKLGEQKVERVVESTKWTNTYARTVLKALLKHGVTAGQLNEALKPLEAEHRAELQATTKPTNAKSAKEQDQVIEQLSKAAA
jgi:hypothetical protein